MLKGMNRYSLMADNEGKKNIHMRADIGRGGFGATGGSFATGAPQTVTGTTSGTGSITSIGSNKKNIERYERDILEGFIAYNTNTSSRKIQNDMYFHDSIIGTVCNIRANIPFSNFELSGTESKERREKYTSSVNAMQIRSMLPKIALERMVEGAHVSYMNFDDSSKKFTSIIPHNPEHCTITPVPIFGRDPLIDVKFPDHILNCVNSEDPDMRNELEKYAEDLLLMVKEKKTRLDPKFTLYLARTPFPWSPYGISYLRRLIPIWLYEKSLARGTIDLAGRRQKALMHIIMGDEEWLPTNEQLKQITQLFVDADNDSVGAMVATRPGIETNELRCLGGKTLIHTENGLQQIQSMYPHDINNGPTTYKVNNLKVRGIDGSLVPVSEWHYQGIKPTVNIYTETRSHLNLTKKHKLLVCRNGGLELVKVEDINIENDYVCMEMSGNVNNTSLPLNLEYPEVIERKENFNITLPSKMSPDLAYILGLVISEGWVGKNSIQISNTDLEILTKYAECVERVFNKIPTIRKSRDESEQTFKCGNTYTTKKSYVAEIHSRVIIDIFKQLGLFVKNRKLNKHSAYYKKVPWSILQADEESKLAFLAVYVDGDGSINKSRRSIDNVSLSFFSRSVSILRSIKYMLSDMGYHSKYDPKPLYRLNVYTYGSSILYNKMSKYLVTRKKHYESCETVRNQKYGIPADIFVPVLKDRFIRTFISKKQPSGAWFTNDEGKPVFIERGWGDLFRHYIAGKSCFLYSNYDNGGYWEELALIKKVSVKLHDNLVHLFQMRYKFEKIIKITEGKTVPTYDLTIDENYDPIFMANGILVKNSGSDHWRWDEGFDTVTTMKLRGLGVPDSIFGDFTTQVAEATISSFLEDMIAEREEMTQRIFYNKMFLIIADENGFKKSEKQKELTGSEDKRIALLREMIGQTDRITHNSQHVLFSSDESIDPAEFDLPQLRWEKSLKIVSNDALFNNLGTLAERGMPAPLRYQMALLGIPAEDMFAALPQDLEDRKIIDEYAKKLPKPPAEPGEDDGGGGNMFMESSMDRLRKVLGSNITAKTQPMIRSFDGIEQRDPKTGKVLSRRGRQVKVDQENKKILEAAARIRESGKYDEPKRNRNSFSYNRKG